MVTWFNEFMRGVRAAGLKGACLGWTNGADNPRPSAGRISQSDEASEW